MLKKCLCLNFVCFLRFINVLRLVLQGDLEKGLEMKKLVLSGFLASEEIYINQLDALLLVRTSNTCRAEVCSQSLQFPETLLHVEHFVTSCLIGRTLHFDQHLVEERI